MENELSAELREYLKRCGFSKGKIAKCNTGTRMYHDLGLYGEIAETCIDMLAHQYQVDLTGLEFEKFFPPEFAGKSMLTRTLLWVMPFAGKAVRQRGEYLPLTLGMIEKVIRTKRWSAVER
ncbi:hypothetical protein [Polaromonas sp. YR568]|uniref:hypothetical protein n=1 Tax=Polaromonas sp. YR568 TaxID=1855301 RepID=UPI00398C1CEC